ncbi:DUF397 domain-containing protein [Streptomyces rectiverticillatus]|uniref:DUF397 domain-containing protein n=1 Tax=Streptomyces rectiverticillatus TaxID=173860 RepID=UPI0015C314B7|nr:DUF397 domain-containing protein [Streptomyces rectiverticillatus]QLE74057.1 DUF397 domain-containing protein [Streptomyces rectiverticillatus]
MSATHALSRAEWVKSSYSNGDGGTCVEWAPALATAHGIVPVRDSKIPGGPVLAFGAEGWASFVAAVRGSRIPG